MKPNNLATAPVERSEFDGHVYFTEGGRPDIAGMLHEVLRGEAGAQLVRFKRSAPVEDTDPGIHIHDVHEDPKTNQGLLEIGVQFERKSGGRAWIALCYIVRPDVESANALRSRLIRENVKPGAKRNHFYLMGDKNYCPPIRREKIEAPAAEVDADTLLAATLAMQKPKELPRSQRKELEAEAHLADPKDNDSSEDGADEVPPENGEKPEGSPDGQLIVPPKPLPQTSPRKEDTGFKALGRKPKPHAEERVEQAEKKLLSYAFLRDPGNETQLAIALRMIVNCSADWAVARRELNKIFYPDAPEVPGVDAFKALIAKLQGSDYGYLKDKDSRNVLTAKGTDFLNKFGKVQTEPVKLSPAQQIELEKKARDQYGKLLKKFQNPETAAVLKILEHFSTSPREAKKAVDGFLFPSGVIPSDGSFDLFIELAKNSYGLLQKGPGPFIATPPGRIILRTQEKGLSPELRKRLASLLVTEVVVHGVVANPKEGPAKKAPPTFVPFPPTQAPAGSSTLTTNQGVKPMPPTKPAQPPAAPKPPPAVVVKTTEAPPPPPPAPPVKPVDQPMVENKAPDNPVPPLVGGPENQVATLPASEPSSDGKALGETATGSPADSGKENGAAASDSGSDDTGDKEGEDGGDLNTQGTIAFRGPYRDIFRPVEGNEAMLAQILYAFIGTSTMSKLDRPKVKAAVDEIRQVKKTPKDGQFKRFAKSLIAFGYLERDSKYTYAAGKLGLELIKKYPNQKVEERKEDTPKVTTPVKVKRVIASASIYGGLQDLSRRHLLAQVLKVFLETRNTEEAQKLIDPIVLPSLTETPSRKTFGCFVTKFVEEGWLVKIKQGVYRLTGSAEVIVANEFESTKKVPAQPPSEKPNPLPLPSEQASAPGKMSRGDKLRLAARYADLEDEKEDIARQLGQSTIDSLLAEVE
jgi:hypothetical protein